MSGGSQQLRIFRRAIRDGESVEDASTQAGIPVAEGRDHYARDLKDPPPPEAFELLREAAPTAQQLDRYQSARRAGRTMTTAAIEAGLSLGAARRIEADRLDDEPEPSPTPATPAASPAKDTTMATQPTDTPRRGRKPKDVDTKVEEVAKPDFARAARVLRGDIKPAEEKNAKSRGDLSAAWKVIEDDCHVNKKAAKDCHRLINMSDENRDDYLRSLYGMMKEMGVGISRDLVDQMGDGDAPTMPVAERQPLDLHTVN